ncbi:MAG: glycosyltransferase [Rubrivivax sp.]|nr:MAG: glycosyltransferase [Rubrivivax sp.]
MSGNALSALLERKDGRITIAGTPFDVLHESDVLDILRERKADLPFEYIATPNVDHVVRTQRLGCRDLYDDAWMSLCDSRVLATLALLLNVRFPSVIPGSDLTVKIFTDFLRDGDHVTIVGCDPENMRILREKYPNLVIHHHNPPMGFVSKPDAVRAAVDFVLQHPSRFVFLAVGSPQQEILARAIKKAGGVGLGLCIGASILFLTGGEKRAPKWVQAIGFEWTFRLLNNPGRLWKRYLVQNPVIFFLVFKQMLTKGSGE